MFCTVGYGTSITQETTGTITIYCGDNILLPSRTATATLSITEHWGYFFPLPWKLLSYSIISNFFVILHKTNGDTGPPIFRIYFIQRLFWLWYNYFTSNCFSCNARFICGEAANACSQSVFFLKLENNANRFAL